MGVVCLKPDGSDCGAFKKKKAFYYTDYRKPLNSLVRSA